MTVMASYIFLPMPQTSHQYLIISLKSRAILDKTLTKHVQISENMDAAQK
jgi:hypothetical protein